MYHLPSDTDRLYFSRTEGRKGFHKVSDSAQTEEQNFFRI